MGEEHLENLLDENNIIMIKTWKTKIHELKCSGELLNNNNSARELRPLSCSCTSERARTLKCKIIMRTKLGERKAIAVTQLANIGH